MPFKPVSAGFLLSSRCADLQCSSMPFCSCVPRMALKSGPQLIQLSCLRCSSLCDPPSFAVHAVSRAVFLLRSSFRTMLLPHGIPSGGVLSSLSGMEWFKLIQ